MSKINFLILIVITFILISCENVSVIDPQLTTKEYVVVRSELKAWTNFEGVSFTRTLPIGEVYDTNKSYLKNVIAYLKINSIQIIPLHYSQGGIYTPYGNVFIKPGDIFELFGTTNGQRVYGKTKIPNQPNVTNASFSNKHIDVSIQSKPSEVYGAVWAIVEPANNSLIDIGKDFLSIVNSTYNNSQSTTSVATTDIPDQYTSDDYKNYRFVKAYAFDEPYLKYFSTKNNNQPVSNAFVQGGDQIIWNVQGKNVIGLFIGTASSGYIGSN